MSRVNVEKKTIFSAVLILLIYVQNPQKKLSSVVPLPFTSEQNEISLVYRTNEWKDF